MYNLYNLQANEQVDNFLKSFRNYLVSEKASSITVRSYVSDARFFLKWFLPFMAEGLKSASSVELSNLLNKINSKILEQYGFYLISQDTPLKSINRKYSALRKMGTFGMNQKMITENVFDHLKNLNLSTPLPETKYHLSQFKSELLKNKVTENTVKNYLADIRQFLAWSESHL